MIFTIMKGKLCSSICEMLKSKYQNFLENINISISIDEKRKKVYFEPTIFLSETPTTEELSELKMDVYENVMKETNSIPVARNGWKLEHSSLQK